MDLAAWLAFAAASLAMGLLPGPGVTSIVGYALSSGQRTALASVAGMALGNALAMTLSLAGVGAVLAASAAAFSALKWAGAAYLVVLGVIAIVRSRRDAEAAVADAAAIPACTAFWSNVAIGTFHPKTIVFFVAFAPQFISAKAAYAPQAAILIATFVGIVGLTDSLYAMAASRAARLLKGPRVMLWSKRAGGGVLIAAGVATAASK